MIYRLVILNGERRSERITVTAEPMIIGRAETCDIRFNDPEIALTHAEISHKPEGLFIRDLGSMNRLLINNREAREIHPKHGDVVEVGQTRFLVQAYVQAEVQGENEDNPTDYKRWLTSVGVLLVIAGVFYAMFQCRPTIPIRPPRTGDTAPSRTNKTVHPPVPAPQPAHRPVPPAVSADAAPAQAPTAPPQPRDKAPITNAEPAATAPSIETPAEFPADTNAAAEAIAVAQRELQEAANTLLESKVRDMMEEALNLASNKGPAAAEQLLTVIETIKPDFLDASTARAAMLEEQGKLEPALALWTSILNRGTNTPLAERAGTRLQQLARAREQLVFPFVGRIRIVEAGISKFPENERYRDMRLLTLRLVATELQKEIDTDAVRVEIRFYDRDPQTGRTVPTDAKVPATPLTVQGPWRATEEKTLEASYVAPALEAANGPAPQYYGFVIRVRYYGALQDERVQPKALSADVAWPPATNTPAATPTATEF